MASSFNLWAQDGEFHSPDYSKPILSLRCKELLKERDLKVKTLQKYNSLLQRNRDMVKKAPKAKPSFHNRLDSTQVKIQSQITQTEESIKNMEENIVRSGCPGIAL